MLAADFSCAVRSCCQHPSGFPRHATSQHSHKISRGKPYYFRCIDAGFIKYAPNVNGGLRCSVPARPERTTPHIQFLFVTPHLRSAALPSDTASQLCPCASLVLRLHVLLDRGLSPPSNTTCTAHTSRRTAEIASSVPSYCYPSNIFTSILSFLSMK